MRILAVSDSDSYLKWATALLAQLPPGGQVRHLVVDNVIAPSPAQIAAAVEPRSGLEPVASAPEVGRTHALALPARISRWRPDALLLAATGPALEAILEILLRAGSLGEGRPVLVTGLPGISFPANDLAIRHRRACDLMVLHSHREVAAYAGVAARQQRRLEIGLATLPFLAASTPAPGGDEVIFAAQALVPAAESDRIAVLEALSALPETLRPVVKVRALAGERQAHNEALPYAHLAAGLDLPRRIEFRAGSMAAALRSAAGFATVSSTAALEALAAGVPTLVLDSFGVGDDLINTVFEGSGLFGGLPELSAGRFRDPDPRWSHDNYFHPPADNDWIERLTALVQQRAAGELPPAGFRPEGSILTRLRRQARVLPPGFTWRLAHRR